MVSMEARTFAGKYVVERELGEAAGGRTFLATAPDGSRVVVKVVHPVDAAAAEDVERDVSLISGIRHPALPAIHEWGHDGRDLFVVREYVPGADLELELGQQGRFAPVTAARYGAEAADALSQIHRRGLVHGNVKTANIIRTPEDEIKVVGSSLGLAEPGLASGAPPTAAYYLAPEQVEGGALSPATDVYAMGVVLYEMITGHVPFDGPMAAAVADEHLHAVPAPIGDSVPDMSPALETVIMRSLEKSPGARFADGEALRAALVSVYEPVSPSSAPAGSAPARSRSPWPWVGVGVVVVLAALGIAWAMGAFAPAVHEAVVPNVAGMTQADASVAVIRAGLQLGAVTFSGRSVTGVPDGSVASQSPAAGTKVDPASRIDLVLSGVESVKVPNVIGLTATQATINLQAAGLVAGTVTNVATASVPAGMVLVQSPVAGTAAAKGTAVDLQVSQGSVAVPDVVGATQSDAESAVESAGFVASVTQKSSSSVPSGRVIEQNPTAGVQARPGSTVTIVVSTGPGLVAVPDVVTMTQADAVNALTAAGFTSHVTLHTGGGTVGTVIDQTPNAGVKAAPGSTVEITVVQ
jgi:serine/threonine-protein kinase